MPTRGPPGRPRIRWPPGLSRAGEGRLGLPGTGVGEGCATHPGRAASRRSAGPPPPSLVGVSGLPRGTSALRSHSPWGVASAPVFLTGSVLTVFIYISGPDLFPALPLPSRVSVANVIGISRLAFQSPPLLLRQPAPLCYSSSVPTLGSSLDPLSHAPRAQCQ